MFESKYISENHKESICDLISYKYIFFTRRVREGFREQDKSEHSTGCTVAP